MADGKVVIEIEAEDREAEKKLQALKQAISDVEKVSGKASGTTENLRQKYGQLTSGLEQTDGSLALLQAELQKNSAQLDGNGSSTELLKERQDLLQRALEASREKVQLLGSQMEYAAELYGENSDEAESLRLELTNAEAQEQKFASQLQEATQQLQRNTDSAKKNTRATKNAADSLKSAGKSISDTGEKIAKVGSSMTKYITTPVLAAGIAATKCASDYEENLNKVDAAFKDSAKVVKDWAKTATKQFGMSESAALEATSLFGDMGTSMGLTTTEAAKMSTSLAGLAGDLSSFKNIGIDEAMTALKGVFTGETESLKTLGVVMTETNLKQFASDAGLVYDEMDQAQRVTLRYKYVLEKTKNAQGDYARTSDGTANSMRTLAAEAENAAAAFGEEILPTITPMIQGLTDLIRKFGELDEGTKKNIVSAALFAAGVGPVVTGVGKITEGVGKAATGIGELTAFVAGGGGLNIALGAGAVAAIGLGTAFATAVVEANRMDEATQEVYRSMEQTAAQGQAQRAEIEGNSAAALALVDDLEALAQKENKSSAEKERMKSLVSSLNSLVPDLGASYDDLSDSLSMATDDMRDFVKQSAKTQVLTSYQEDLTNAYKDQADAFADLKKKQDKAKDAADNYKKEQERLNQALADGTVDQQMYDSALAVAKTEMDNANKAAKDAQEAYDGTSDAVSGAETAIDSYSEALGTATGNQSKNTDATKKDADAKKEQAQATQEATTAIWGIASAAIDARYSSEDLRASYEDLKGQLDKVRESGEAKAIQAAEEKLAVLELAATNQELAATYTTLGIATGESLTQMSEYLIATGTSTADFAAGVTAMRDSVVNDFQSIVNENALTADQIIENLETNLQVQQQWSQNLSNMWEQAKTDQDTNVMAFINYLREKGPEYAGEVQSFADAGYEELKRAAELWGGAATQSVNDYATQIEAEKYLAEQAGAEIGQSALNSAALADFYGQGADSTSRFSAGAGSVDAAPSGQGMTSQVAAGILSGQPEVELAAQQLALSAHGAMAQISWADLGEAIGQGISNGVEASAQKVYDAGAAAGESLADGLRDQKSEVRTAAKALSSTVTDLWKSNAWAFKTAGSSAGIQIRTGLTSQLASVRAAGKNLADAVTAIWSSQSSVFRQRGFDAGTQLKIGLMQQLGSVRTAGQTLASSVPSAWRAAAGQFRSAGASASSSLASGIWSGASGVAGAASSVAYRAQSSMRIGGWYSLGYNISAGVADGVYGGSYLISSAARSAAYSALYAAKAALGIRSPSRVFRDQVGRMIPAGMALGIRTGAPDACRAVEVTAQQLLQATHTALRPSGSMTAPQAVPSAANYDRTIIGGRRTIQVEAPVYLDSREIARAIARPTGRQMAYLEGL